MRRLRLTATIVSLLLLVSGCASLEVDVRVFDPVCHDEVAFLRARALDQASRQRVLLNTGVYNRALDGLVALAGEEAKRLQICNDPQDVTCEGVAPEFRDGFQTEVARVLGERFGAIQRRLRKGIEAVDAAEQTPRSETETRRDRYALAIESFNQSREELLGLRDGLAREYDAKGKEAMALVLETTSRVAAQLASSSGLFDDHYAAAVVAADGDCWDPEYNNAYGVGLFGNSDIAIKMEDAGDYSIKGVRMDAAAVTRATFGAVRQGISIAAAAYGVPLPAEQRPSGSTGAQAIAELDSITNAQQDAGARARLSQMAIWGLLDSIAQRQDGLEATDLAQQKAAFEALQAVYRVYRPQLAGEQ